MQPTCETIAEVHPTLNANATSVHSHRGNGQVGLLFLTVAPDVHITLSSIPFDPPENPGQEPIIPEGSTGPHISETHGKHEQKNMHF